MVIAHRGASGYLPEHSLPAKALAHGMGADFLEQDVIATRDGELIVFHDRTLDQLTDVAQRFPGRARADGHFYCIDFDLREIRELSLHERLRDDGSLQWPNRFPATAGTFVVPTLAEELRFIDGLNRSTGREAGVYPEIKDPEWHRAHGIDLAGKILACLDEAGYLAPGRRLHLQSFDPRDLRRVRDEAPAHLSLIQLLADDWTPAAISLEDIADYAQGIGPAMALCEIPGRDGRLLTERAHELNLMVHPYTFRADGLPSGTQDFDCLLKRFLIEHRVDGVFTDFPDLVRRFIDGAQN